MNRMNHFCFALCLIEACSVACNTTDTPSIATPKTDTAAVAPKTTEPPKDGPQVISTQDGGRMEGELLDGKREGPWASFFPNGGIRSRITFKGGMEEGPTEVYHDNGMTYYTGQYRAGVTVGEWTFYDPQGKELKRVVYDSLGVKLK